MYGKYIPNQKFDSITISILSDKTEILKKNYHIKDVKNIILHKNNAKKLSRNWFKK